MNNDSNDLNFYLPLVFYLLQRQHYGPWRHDGEKHKFVPPPPQFSFTRNGKIRAMCFPSKDTPTCMHASYFTESFVLRLHFLFPPFLVTFQNSLAQMGGFMEGIPTVI